MEARNRETTLGITHCTRALAIALAFLEIGFVAPGYAGSPREEAVSLIKTPFGGIQPQALIDAEGTLHLLYFRGDPYRGDLFYTHRGPGAEEFSPPLRVNSKEGTAVAVGTIRGGQLAWGRRGRIHIVWNGPVSPPTQDAPH